MNKKIIFAANTSWYLYNFRAATLKAFLENGYDVVCLAPKDKYSHKLSKIGCQWQNIELDNNGNNPFKDFLFFLTLIKIYLKYKPHVVFHFTIKNNIYGTIAAKICNIKAINNISGLGTAFIHNNLTTKIVRLLYRISQPLAYAIYCQNKDDYTLLVNDNLVSSNKLSILPGSGVDTHRFHPTLKQKNNINQFRFLYVGRMLADKGLYELIEAATMLYQQGYAFRLSLCGFIDSKNQSVIPSHIIDSWKKLPFIHWLGNIDNIETIYAYCDCVVLATYREGMPRSLLEAGAMGLPSVATNVAGCKHIIEDGVNGFLCDVKNPTSLFTAMIKMITLDPRRYQQMCIQARNKILDKFDEKIVVDEALRIAKIDA